MDSDVNEARIIEAEAEAKTNEAEAEASFGLEAEAGLEAETGLEAEAKSQTKTYYMFHYVMRLKTVTKMIAFSILFSITE